MLKKKFFGKPYYIGNVCIPIFAYIQTKQKSKVCGRYGNKYTFSSYNMQSGIFHKYSLHNLDIYLIPLLNYITIAEFIMFIWINQCKLKIMQYQFFLGKKTNKILLKVG